MCVCDKIFSLSVLKKFLRIICIMLLYHYSLIYFFLLPFL